MRIRTKKWARPELAACHYFISNPTEYKNRWQTMFAKKQPIHLDLGCGKGIFLAELAYLHPNINFIGVDISMDILGVARRNIQQRFGDKIPENLLLTSMNIEYCADTFGVDDAISKIYICFCNPWSKNRHKKRRLTHNKQLQNYRQFLQPNAELYFKTDDTGLFDDSLSYLKQNGFSIRFCTYDLPMDMKDNILSEHEIRFREEGIPIKMLLASMEPETPNKN